MFFTNQTPKKEKSKFHENEKIVYKNIDGIVAKVIHKGLGMGFKYAIILNESINGNNNYIVEESHLTKRSKIMKTDK